MGRVSRAEIMNCNIRNAITTFLNMTTEERISPRVISVFCIILGLVFCSFVVSYKIVDIAYFIVVLVSMINYINLKRIK